MTYILPKMLYPSIMIEPNPTRTARALPSLFALCIFLGACTLLTLGAAVFLFASGAALYGGLALLVAGMLAAAAVGLYQLRRWGVVVFGLLAMLGSINHLAAALLRYNTLSIGDPLRVLEALFSILLAIAIPILLIYLTLLLWRKIK